MSRSPGNYDGKRVGTAMTVAGRGRSRRYCKQCGRDWRSRFPLCRVCFQDKKNTERVRRMQSRAAS